MCCDVFVLQLKIAIIANFLALDHKFLVLVIGLLHITNIPRIDSNVILAYVPLSTCKSHQCTCVAWLREPLVPVVFSVSLGCT